MTDSRTGLVAVLAAGTFAGAQLMIGISFGAQWREASDAELVARFAGDWTNIATTIIPFALVQTAAIPLALYLARHDRAARSFWALALASWLINCAITAAYHFPVVWAAMQHSYTEPQIHAVVSRWVAVHWIRIVLGYATFLFALLAMLRSRLFPQPS